MLTNASVCYLLVGALLLLMVLLQSALKRLPVSAGMVYLLIGIALGPLGLDGLRIDALRDAGMLERIAEVAMLVSLFSVGLKMRLPLRHRDWRIAVRLAAGALVFTIAPLTLIAMWLLHLPFAHALLLAAILAPTDPVLASDVQLRHPGDRDRMRFSLTAEGGMNDGIALPFVMLALVLITNPGQSLSHWLLADVLWPTPVGIACGWLCGYTAGRLTTRMRRQDADAIGLDEFLALGVMGVAYAIAQLAQANGFLAVFAAGLALRRVELAEVEEHDVHVPLEKIEAQAPPEAPVHLMRAMLTFNEQLERIIEVAVVLLLGGLLRVEQLTPAAIALAAMLFVIVRPLSVLIAFADRAVPWRQLRLMGWFGIRGVGSLYYLVYAVNHGIDPAIAHTIASVVLPVLAASVIVHGISATPLMERYSRQRTRRQSPDA